MADTVCVDEVRACLIAVLAKNLVTIAQLAHGTPLGREIIDRMRKPVVGDMVVMTLVLNQKDLHRRVGVLEEVRPDPLGGHIYVVRNVHENPNTVTEWSNADCVALPVSFYSGLRTDRMFLPAGSPSGIPLALYQWSANLPKRLPDE